MKRAFVTVLAFLAFAPLSEACERSTIDNMMKEVDPYYVNKVGAQTSASLGTLALCDQNMEYAGALLASKFDPYYNNSVYSMVMAVLNHGVSSLSDEMRLGMGLGLIKRVDLYYPNSTANMLELIKVLPADSYQAKTFALQLLSKQDAYYPTNNALLAAVRNLQSQATRPAPIPEPAPVSAWAFRSHTERCSDVTGPWGRYEMCPRYSASVSDDYGNRVILTCKAEYAGVDVRVLLSNENWGRVSRARLQSIAFGTGTFVQRMGQPYVMSDSRSLLAEEPLSPETLSSLRRGKSLRVDIRANSGELRIPVDFTLSGSNAAITQLLEVCR